MRTKCKAFLLVLMIISVKYSRLDAQTSVVTSGMRTGKLTCEYMEAPLGIDIASPRFGWTLLSGGRSAEQRGYELLVSSDRDGILRLHGDMWASGKVDTSQSLHIVYSGKPLKSFTRYYWRVRVYDKQGRPSIWSEPAWFETAMLSPGDWRANWIGEGGDGPANDEDFYKDRPAPLFRKGFKVSKKLRSARWYIAGVGYYEAYLNGKKTGDHVLSPGWTSYGKRVLYSVYDITGALKMGDNMAGVMLGNGWYDPLPLRMWGDRNLRQRLYTGRPCVKAELRIEYEDGSKEIVATDESWQTMAGPVMRNNIYLGEHYDARMERSWWNRPGPDGAEERQGKGMLKNAVAVQGPEGALRAEMQPPIRVISVVRPVRITTPAPGVFLFDMGQNFAGVARIHLSAAAGTRVVLRYGEDIYKDGSLNVMTSVAGQVKSGNGGPGAPPVAWQEDSYTAKGQGVETWSPRFTFHGFRYVEVRGWPGRPKLTDVEGVQLSADVADAGVFECSNSMLNQLARNIRWTFKSNLFSVQSDCPAREKYGYGGDMFCTTEAFDYNFNMANFYRKVVDDMADDQRPLGGITETAPFVGIADSSPGDKSGPLGFQIGFTYAIQQLYEFYGDRRIIEDHYGALKKQVNFLRDSAKTNLYAVDLSDHESLDAKPVAFTASAFYYHHVLLLARFAGLLGRADDAVTYGRLADTIRRTIVDTFFDAATGRFANGTQSAQVFGLWYDLVSGEEKKKALQVLLEAIGRSNGHLSTGIFGTKMLLDVLRREGRNDVAYAIADQRTFPGWGYMIARGATTVWETWAYSDNVYSQNHPMFGSVGEWFYRSLLGINPGAPGFEKVVIKPQPAGDLHSAEGSYVSVRGLIVSRWTQTGHGYNLHVEVPANVRAEVWLPMKGAGDRLTEGGLPLERTADVKLLRIEDGYAVLETGSGKYDLASAGDDDGSPGVRQSVSIIPNPTHLVEKKGAFVLAAGAHIHINSESMGSLADYLAHRIREYSGVYVRAGADAGEARSIRLLLDSSAEKSASEGYRLTVSPENIIIRAATPRGVFYGVQTLLQLLPLPGGRTVPCVEIEDAPRFGWRGMMLDVSRHFFTVNDIKKMIDEMAVYKFNLLHLHLTDDQGWRLEIKSLPALTATGAWRVPRTGYWGNRQPPGDGEPATDGGFYTQDEIRDIIRYAASRCIRILPEIDVPAHSLAAIASYPWLSCNKQQYHVNPGSNFYAIEDNALCPGQEATFEWLDKVFGEVAKLFPFEYIHVGGDECFKGFWKKCPACQQRMKDNGLKNEEELQSYFVRRLEKILEAKGKKLLGWDEILEGGLAPSATVMSWRGINGGIEAAKAKHLVVMSPTSNAYLDLYQGDPAIEPPTFGKLRLKDVYTFDPVPHDVDPAYILGGQGNLWTESVPTFRHAEYMLWPRGLALSEALWSPLADRNWNGFVGRMEQEMQRLGRRDINYALSCYDPIITSYWDSAGSLKIRLQEEAGALDFYYTFDNTYPDRHAQHYRPGGSIPIPTDADVFKVVSYRDGQKIGRIISIPVDELQRRAINKKPAAPRSVKVEDVHDGGPYEMSLYTGTIPGAISGPDEEEHTYDPAVDSLINKVSRPTLTAYLPPAGSANRKAVIICPGGGYHTLLINREGRQVAEAFNKAGVAAFVLKYRLPSDRTMKDKSSGPLQDLQQAIRLVRGNAAKWHLDPHDIGVMGFSAGGHLAALAGTHFEQPPADNPSDVSLRPDFMILIYPVISLTDSIGHIGSRNYLLGAAPVAKKIFQYSNEFHVTRATPPAFITHAGDDDVVPPAGSLKMYSALMRAGVPSELDMYARGGHGYLHEPAFEEWFGRCLRWLQVKAP